MSGIYAFKICTFTTDKQFEMINEKLFRPESIAVIGASNNIMKPGGKIVKNLTEHAFQGEIFVVNPKEDEIQGIPAFSNVADLPNVDLAILAIPAQFCLPAVEVLASQKNTKAFIIISAGFGETSEEGKKLEQQIVEVVNRHNACLIGPNCIGVMTPMDAILFPAPVPLRYLSWNQEFRKGYVLPMFFRWVTAPKPAWKMFWLISMKRMNRA